MSIRKYAISKGCSEGNVRSAIKSGKITKGVEYHPETGRIKGIIVDIANKEWAKNYNMERIRNKSVLKSLGIESMRKVTDKEKAKPATTNIIENNYDAISGGDEEAEIDIESVSLEKETIFEAKRKESVYKAKLLEFQVLEKRKELINANKVYKALFDFTSQASSTILAVPDRIIDNLLACDSRADAYNLLNAALVDALNKLSNRKPKGL